MTTKTDDDSRITENPFPALKASELVKQIEEASAFPPRFAARDDGRSQPLPLGGGRADRIRRHPRTASMALPRNQRSSKAVREVTGLGLGEAKALVGRPLPRPSKRSRFPKKRKPPRIKKTVEEVGGKVIRQ